MGWADLPSPVREALKSLAQELRPQGLELFLFGSFAEGRAWPTSDLDIAYTGRFSQATEKELRHRLEELPTIRPVDLVPLATATPALIDEVHRTGLPLADQ